MDGVCFIFEKGDEVSGMDMDMVGDVPSLRMIAVRLLLHLTVSILRLTYTKKMWCPTTH